VRAMGSGVLVLEAIVLMLAAIPMTTLGNVSWQTSVVVCVGLGLAAVLTCGLLGRPAGVVAGSLVQVAAIGLGFVVPIMFVLGAVFAALWVVAVVLGRRVDAAKAARTAPD